MHDNRPSVPSPALMIASRKILRIPLKLDILGIHAIRHNLHALLPFIRCFAVTRFFIVEDNDLTEGVLDLIALLARLVPPLFELGERNMLDLLAGFHPGSLLQHFIIIRIHVTNMSDDSKLYSTG